jgi:hypothetical protein
MDRRADVALPAGTMMMIRRLARLPSRRAYRVEGKVARM